MVRCYANIKVLPKSNIYYIYNIYIIISTIHIIQIKITYMVCTPFTNGKTSGEAIFLTDQVYFENKLKASEVMRQTRDRTLVTHSINTPS